VRRSEQTQSCCTPHRRRMRNFPLAGIGNRTPVSLHFARGWRPVGRSG
jgi:hypothetical protein